MGLVEDKYKARIKARLDSGQCSWRKRMDAGERYRPRKKPDPSNPSEHQEQRLVKEALDYSNVRYYAVPNGGRRDSITASILRSEGVQRGVPDLVIFTDELCIYLEMKKRFDGVVSKEQQEWLDFFNNRPGFKGIVGLGADDAIEQLRELGVFGKPVESTLLSVG